MPIVWFPLRPPLPVHLPDGLLNGWYDAKFYGPCTIFGFILMPARSQDRPEDFNAFGYDPRGRVANISGLMFGEDWRPNPQDIPRYHGLEITAPRWGPPAPYQIPHLPPSYVPNMPQDGYLGALQFQRRQGPWANVPLPGQPQVPPNGPPPALDQPHIVPHPSVPCQANGPNSEVSPGIYRLVIAVNTSSVQKQFTVESDISYEDLRSRACANLDIDAATASLGYRISGLEGPKTLPSALDSAEDHQHAMERVTLLILRARTKEYGLEIVNLKPVIVKLTSSKGKKRRREEDIPPEDKENNDTLTSEYCKLAAHTTCESCKGNCHIMCNGTHQRLDYKELSYWAKQNILGASDIYNPPDAICFNRRSKRARPLTRSGAGSTNEIHVHLDGLGNALHFGGSILSNSVQETPSDGSPVVQTPPNTTPPIIEKPSTKTAHGNHLSPTPYANDNIFHSDSPSPLPLLPLNLRSPPIREVLVALQAIKSNYRYLDMLPALCDAGIETLADVASKRVQELVEWTGLPNLQLADLQNYAWRWEELSRFTSAQPTSEESPDTVTDDDNGDDDESRRDYCSTPEI